LSQPDLARLVEADEPGPSDSWPYARCFAQQAFREDSYRRFWGDAADPPWMDTYIGNSGHAFVMVGNATTTHSNFFIDTIRGALAHFHHHYFLMALAAQFHKAALLSFLARTAEVVEQWDRGAEADTNERFATEVQTINKDFLQFTNRYWFLDVSNQLQAQEHFAMWRRKLKLEEHFQAVRQRLLDLHEHLQTQRSIDISEKAHALGRPVLIVGLIALVVGALGTNLIPGWSWPIDCSLANVGRPECRVLGWLIAWYVVVAVSSGIAVTFIYRYLSRKLWKKRQNECSEPGP
jgi:hypothetical protein